MVRKPVQFLYLKNSTRIPLQNIFSNFRWMGFGHSIHVPGPATEPAGRTRYSGVRWQCSQCNRPLTNSVRVSQTPEHPLVCAAGGFHIFHYVLWAGVWLALLLLCQQTTPGMNSDSVIIPFLVSILNTPQHNVHDQWRIQNFRRGGGRLWKSNISQNTRPFWVRNLNMPVNAL